MNTSCLPFSSIMDAKARNKRKAWATKSKGGIKSVGGGERRRGGEQEEKKRRKVEKKKRFSNAKN